MSQEQRIYMTAGLLAVGVGGFLVYSYFSGKKKEQAALDAQIFAAKNLILTDPKALADYESKLTSYDNTFFKTGIDLNQQKIDQYKSTLSGLDPVANKAYYDQINKLLQMELLIQSEKTINDDPMKDTYLIFYTAVRQYDWYLTKIAKILNPKEPLKFTQFLTSKWRIYNTIAETGEENRETGKQDYTNDNVWWEDLRRMGLLKEIDDHRLAVSSGKIKTVVWPAGWQGSLWNEAGIPGVAITNNVASALAGFEKLHGASYF
jgi:hypothetical protein